VVCEALASTLIAPGLLYITRAHATADFKMVSAISLFVVSSCVAVGLLQHVNAKCSASGLAVGFTSSLPRPPTPACLPPPPHLGTKALSSPLGAAILAKLDAKRVELVMASALLAIILVEQVSALLQHCRQRRQQRGQVEAAAAVKQPPPDCGDATAAAAAAGQADCTVCLFEGDGGAFAGVLCKASGQRDGSSSSSSSSSSKAWVANDTAAAAPDQEGSEREPLLAAYHHHGSSTDDAASSSGSDAAAAEEPAGQVQASTSSSSRWSGARAWLRVLGIGAVAGTLSGIMEGLTG
jgi:hypothetical protein